MRDPSNASITPVPKRVLLIDLSERERHELREMLQAAGFDVAIARGRADAFLRLLTWQPHGVVADHDLASLELADLLDVIRASAPMPPSIVLMCNAPPHEQTFGKVLIKPVPFLELLSTLRDSLADREDAPPLSPPQSRRTLDEA